MTSAIENRLRAVLIVEDEPLLRLHVVDIVEEAGFVAIEAKSADEAIAILEQRSDIALLLTDIHMPGSMDGIKLAHAVRGRWPPVKIIVISGRLVVDADQLPPGSRFFGKPFAIEPMIAELRAMVGQ
jgi:CheY-like chemotaxis protein